MTPSGSNRHIEELKRWTPPSDPHVEKLLGHFEIMMDDFYSIHHNHCPAKHFIHDTPSKLRKRIYCHIMFISLLMLEEDGTEFIADFYKNHPELELPDRRI
jgi:hypothetical protein